MKVLITGGGGFIGQRTGQLLLKQSPQVTILDNLSPPAHDGPPALPVGMELVEGDIRKREDWVKALKQNEVVLHLADHHDYLPSFSKLFHVNTVGTAILFELLLEGKTSVRRVVLGASIPPTGSAEAAARPTTPYGLSKLAQDELVRLLCERHGFEWVILRYGA